MVQCSHRGNRLQRLPNLSYERDSSDMCMCYSVIGSTAFAILHRCFFLHSDFSPPSDDFDFQFSDLQLEVFDSWQRPNEIIPQSNPVSPQEDRNRELAGALPARVDLVQDLTTDCSVVASLCASTARSERGHPKVSGGIRLLDTAF